MTPSLAKWIYILTHYWISVLISSCHLRLGLSSAFFLFDFSDWNSVCASHRYIPILSFVSFIIFLEAQILGRMRCHHLQGRRVIWWRVQITKLLMPISPVFCDFVCRGSRYSQRCLKTSPDDAVGIATRLLAGWFDCGRDKRFFCSPKSPCRLWCLLTLKWVRGRGGL